MLKTYKVIGDSIVHGARKGETFVADLEDHAEALLFAGGHVVVVAEKVIKDAPAAVAAVEKVVADVKPPKKG